jgi:four helix bundle protein
MAPGPLWHRTRAFAIDVLKFIDSLPPSRAGRVIGWQLGRAGSAVGANYRRSCRAQSTRDFLSKLKVVEEECDESAFWLDLCGELGLGDSHQADCLATEAGEITAMLVSSIKTLRSKTS